MKAAVAIPSTAPINLTLSKNQSMPVSWHILSPIWGAARGQPLNRSVSVNLMQQYDQVLFMLELPDRQG
jgi:hypothetical protein